MSTLPALTVRAKLTILYGALFLAAGTLLLTITYGLVRHSLESDPTEARIAFVQRAAPPAGQMFPFEVPAGARQDVVEFGAPDPIDPVTGARLSTVIEDVRSTARSATLRRLVVQSGYALGVMAVVSVGLGWVVAGRVLDPVHRITARARRASQENLHERIDLDGPEDELKELADTFDGMLERLGAAFESQRRFVADASHELRTPLAVMRTEIDVALADADASTDELRSTAERVRAAVGRSERLIDSLLVLARSDRGIVEREEVDLAALTQRVVASVPAEGLDVDVDVAPLVVQGDAALLERMVANLVENAVTHNRDGGWVGVTVGEGRVLVANTGDVIDPHQVDPLFEPFRRTGAARTRSARGAGLGLAIVRSVAGAHGATAWARARPEGGLEVEVRFSSASHPGGPTVEPAPS